MSAYDLRVTILIAACLNVVGSVLRTVSVFVATDSSSASGYILLLAGQCLCAVAQPFVCNTPAKVAGNWFPEEEQNVATTIASLINPLGNALGQVVPSLLVRCAATTHGRAKCPKQHIYGFFALLASQAVLTIVMALWAWCCFRAEPDHPPSEAALQRRRLSNKSASTVSNDSLPHQEGKSSVEEMVNFTKEMLQNTQFLILAGGFGIGLGLFNSF